MLRLLARSMALFVEPDHVGRVWVMVNDAEPYQVAAEVERDIVPTFGSLAQKVRILTAVNFKPQEPKRHGYQMQQALKLAVSSVTDAEFYVCLDCKNHFVAPVSEGDWVADGKARMRLESVGDIHRNYWRSSFLTFGVEPPAGPAVPSVTPYVCRSDIARRVLSHVKGKYGKDIFDFLDSEHGRHRTEFFLYYAAMMTDSRGIEALTIFDAWRSYTLFGEWPEPGDENAVRRIKAAHDGKMLGVHRRRFADMHPEERRLLTELWLSCGLMRSESEAEAFIAEVAAAVPRR